MKACILFTSDNEVAEDWLGKFNSREPLYIYGQKYLIDEISTNYEPGFSGVTIKMYPVLQIKIADWPKKEYKMNIDWSKAPEDATHYNTGNKMFYCFSRGNYYFYALNNVDLVFGGSPEDYSDSTLIERPKKQEAWDGVGLPPVGTVCDMHIDDFGWITGTVVVHIDLDEPTAVAHNGEEVFHGNASDFRPIKTAEQLEEEERKTQLEVMNKIYMQGASEHKGGLAALYDAGYKLAK